MAARHICTFLWVAALLGGCCNPQPYKQLYIMAEESRIQKEIDATMCSEPSMASSSEAVLPVSPTVPSEE